MKNSLETYLNFTINIAKTAAENLKEYAGKVAIEFKGKHDLVTKFDKETEALIVKAIKENYPDHNILGEEGTHLEQGESSYRWIIDPIDGTTDFAHGHPFYCVSIGLEINGEVQVGVVYAPAMNDLFYATKGMGAFLNENPIKVSQINIVDKSLLATGFNPTAPNFLNENIRHFKHFQKSAQGVRRCGSAALDMCFVAAGRVDGFWEKGLKAWDIAAGTIIVKEAGGKITAMDGSPFNLNDQDILASNSHLHKEMVDYFVFSEKIS